VTVLARARAALARRAARRRADHALARLARGEGTACHPQCPTCRALDHLAPQEPTP
jgi:hypothetical protein